MHRRSFLTLLGASAAAWPLAARAQQRERMRRIGVLRVRAETDSRVQAQFALLRRSLQKLKWTEGGNVAFDVRSSPDTDRLRLYAAELVSLKPDVIVASGNRALIAMQQQTRTIPIIFSGTSDPVAQGFVESMARPGGNVTGFTNV